MERGVTGSGRGEITKCTLPGPAPSGLLPPDRHCLLKYPETKIVLLAGNQALRGGGGGGGDGGGGGVLGKVS